MLACVRDRIRAIVGAERPGRGRTAYSATITFPAGSSGKIAIPVVTPVSGLDVQQPTPCAGRPDSRRALRKRSRTATLSET